MYVQDPYLKSEEYGQTIDEVENLIKKHEAFEKAAAAQEERFAALERLTTVRHWFGLVVSVPANPGFEYRSLKIFPAESEKIFRTPHFLLLCDVGHFANPGPLEGRSTD